MGDVNTCGLQAQACGGAGATAHESKSYVPDVSALTARGDQYGPCSPTLSPGCMTPSRIFVRVVYQSAIAMNVEIKFTQ